MDERAFRRLFAKGMGKIQKKIAAKRYKCLVPDCKHLAIASHSQQREAQLRSIAREGMVYAMDRNHYRVAKRERVTKDASDENPISMRIQGIGSVSTFPGFCGHHDSELFRCLDLRQGGCLNAEQGWALFLRTYAYEFAQKRRAFDMYTDMEALFADLGDIEDAYESRRRRALVGMMLEIDAPDYLCSIWDIRDGNYLSGLVHHQRIIPRNIGLSTSCVFSPLDFYGRRRAEASSDVQPLVSFNIVPSSFDTLVVASVRSKHAELAQWIAEDLADDMALETLIHRCAFAESEDTCVDPDLWESLSEEKQEAVRHAMEHELHRGPIHGMPRIVSVTI